MPVTPTLGRLRHKDHPCVPGQPGYRLRSHPPDEIKPASLTLDAVLPEPYSNPQDTLDGDKALVVSGRFSSSAPQSHDSLQSPQGELAWATPHLCSAGHPTCSALPQSPPCQVCHLQCHLLMSSPPKMRMSCEYAPGRTIWEVSVNNFLILHGTASP